MSAWPSSAHDIRGERLCGARRGITQRPSGSALLTLWLVAVLIAGGTDWPNLGRKPTGPKVVNEAA